MGTTTGFKERYLNARNRRWINALVWVGTSLLAFVILVQPGATRPSSYTLSAGDVAQQEIQAPYTLEYVSDLLTNQARSDAEQRVGLVYLPADPAISRKQLEHLRTALNFIDAVRFDGYASIEEKLADLALLENLKLTEPDALAILSLNEVRWEAVSRESLAVLEAVMRDTIRDDQTRDAVRRIPTLISFTLPQDQASIVNTLVTPFITANSLLEESLTQQARQEARDKVSPVTKKYIAGETIINRGQVISPLIWEALVQYNLVRSQTTTQDYFSALALVATASIFLALYFNRRKLSFENNLRGLFLLCILFLVFLFLARFVIPNRVVIPYIFPIPAFALTVAILFNLELSLIFSLVLSLLTAFGMPNALDLTSFYILSSMISVLVLGKGQRISNFFWAGLAIALTGSATTLAYRLSNPYTDLNGFVTLIAAVFVNGFASASLSLLFQYGFSQWVGVTTAIQLLEISRPDHPLLQFILQNAPGSYQHSLQVAVLAEQAAEKIGADAMLVRVGGLYHDAGKALNPSFFIENQEGAKLNTHDDLEPEESARIILRHV
ncbi:MAG: HDIG domain-containing protein, partial [Anaerolineae bacterium]|nr:HDIG domain-containing protein [Anaerolineae bacterium]